MRNPNVILLLTVLMGQTMLPGSAQAPGEGVSGPIDITANEQEFSGESVIARGNVRVVYKDSVILAPQATLFRDPAGNPARAIFTGHPRLSQGKNKIDAETLIFEIATSKFVATGSAHSEVESTSDGDDESASAGLGGETSAKPKDSKGAKPGEKKVEHIITDSDKQEYDQASGRFEAIGHVKVKTGDINVISDKLQLVYGANNKPETAVFTGNVTATQNKNSTSADNITYSLSTKRLQATGNVRSKVIQEKKDTGKKPAPGPTAKGDLLTAPATAAATGTGANASSKAPTIGFDMEAGGDDKPLFINSDTQDYSKDNGRVSAHGHVKVTYGEMVGVGPAIIMTRTKDGQPDKVYFNGRSQISQPGRRWIADQITYIVAEKRVIATGNAKAMILQGKPQQQFMPAVPVPTQTAPAPVQRNEKLAEPPNKKKIAENKQILDEKEKEKRAKEWQKQQKQLEHMGDYHPNFPIQM